jgi:hypothetical protein
MATSLARPAAARKPAARGVVRPGGGNDNRDYEKSGRRIRASLEVDGVAIQRL